MKVRKGRGQGLRRRGTVIAQAVIFGGTVGLGVAAMSIDTGLMYTAKQELQSAADAAALAAVGKMGLTMDSLTAAAQEAAFYAARNEIAGKGYSLDVQTSIVYGHAVMNGEKYDFFPEQTPLDAARVTLRRDATASDGPVSLLFAKTLGIGSANIQASATAMLIPRDISVVIDLSGSMNDDSELRHYKDYSSESEGTRDGVQVNLEAVWLSLPWVKGNNGVGNGFDPPPPGNPGNLNDAQPGTGPGSPNSKGGNTSPGADPIGQDGDEGPRWGWMTGFGNAIEFGSYTPVGDPGLYYIPRGANCSDADVAANLAQAGYSAAEQAALLSGAHDSDLTLYKNRVLVCLGLAGWKSKMDPSKYSGGPGNRDTAVDTKELTQQASWNFSGGSWSEYLDYVLSNSTQMYATDSNFRYRFGIKTVVNYLLEKHPEFSSAPELAETPQLPLQSVKDAVQAMVDLVVGLQTDDRMSLEAFGQFGHHLQDLSNPSFGEDLADELQIIPDTLKQYQAAHYTSLTNIGAGFQSALDELSSDRSRVLASKVVILLTDGKPNVDSSGTYVGNDAPAAISWAQDSADALKESGATVYVIGVGSDVNSELCESLATRSENYYYADNAPDEANGGQPKYVTQLQEIFQVLGEKRPVRLIQ